MRNILQQALDEVAKLHAGEVFLVKDLFKGYEWNRLSLNERRNLGRNFFDPSYNPYLKSGEIEAVRKNNANQQVYRKREVRD